MEKKSSVASTITAARKVMWIIGLWVAAPARVGDLLAERLAEYLGGRSGKACLGEDARVPTLNNHTRDLVFPRG